MITINLIAGVAAALVKTRAKKNAYMCQWYAQNKEYVRAWVKTKPEYAERDRLHAKAVYHAKSEVEKREYGAKQRARKLELHGKEGVARQWRDISMRANYGIGQTQYAAMSSEQNGLCAICKAAGSNERHGVLAVDHCHRTGKVRGLLCFCCNSALGAFRDSLVTIRQAAEWLVRETPCLVIIPPTKGTRTRLDYYLWTTYRIFARQYEELLVAQNGRCGVCQTEKPGRNKSRRFCVDHDHLTGTVRGLLCHGCNTGIGKFRDDSLLLHAAVLYLQRYPGE